MWHYIFKVVIIQLIQAVNSIKPGFSADSTHVHTYMVGSKLIVNPSTALYTRHGTTVKQASDYCVMRFTSRN